ncbi:macrophage mannose receptor 1-like [Salarias fasciatus]|uniref:macrophage mannose receptor 1-like n=1 Tax=Salarias fasciatus TaxID=181472 RepID=UPI0011768BF9|nr:macrophage mannose receptor 1-like [Salarias fasciatus]
MDRYLVLFMLLSGLCFLPASLPYKYFLIEKAKSWSEALDYCKERYSNLAIVRNAKDMEQLVDVSQPHLRKQVWIGLRYELTKWLWIQGEGNYVPAEFTMWAPGEPDDHEQGQENCVFARNGFWHDSVCSEEEYFVCSNGPSVTPRFFLMDIKLSKSNAHRHCRRNFTDLASVSNEAENEELKTLTAGVDHWISLFRAPWKWSDGSHMTFYRWNTTLEEPNGGNRTPCVTVRRGAWEDDDCEQQLFFVCQIEIHMKKVMLKGTTENLSLNLEDEAEAILQQLNQTVTDLGLTQAVKLTWTKQPDGKIFHQDKEEVEKSKENTCIVT